MPKRVQKRKRVLLHDRSCTRLRTLRENHVWSYDFVMDRLANGTPIRLLTVIDEYTRKCLAIHSDYKLKSEAVMKVLRDLFGKYGCPEYIRSDNHSEFIAKELVKWLKDLGVKTVCIRPGNPVIRLCIVKQRICYNGHQNRKETNRSLNADKPFGQSGLTLTGTGNIISLRNQPNLVFKGRVKDLH